MNGDDGHPETIGTTDRVQRPPDDYWGDGWIGTSADQPCEWDGDHHRSLEYINVRVRWIRWLPLEHTVLRRDREACSCAVACSHRAMALAAVGGGSFGMGSPTFLCGAHLLWASAHRYMSGPADGSLLAVDPSGIWRHVTQGWLP